MLPLEDNYEDIVTKALRGLGLTDATLAAQAGVAVQAVGAARSGRFDEADARRFAPVLGLDADALVAIGRKAWHPGEIEVGGLAQFTSDYLAMTVNAYVAWDRATRAAVVFDSGADAGRMLHFLEANGLKIAALLLTHTHGDHVAEVETLRARTGNPPLFSGSEEPFGGSSAVDEGWTFEAGGLRVRALATPGHSAGARTYVIDGLPRPVAVVGDAIFAGSMGGAPAAWQTALANNRTKILSLPGDTVLCPGHGPLTTVALEARHNPFYAGAGA
jgi:hydroxyacylglutathione hydrolase